MKQVEVLLNAPERALRFCKSILGICTMDLTVPLTLSIYDETENVLEKIREFLV